MKATISTLLLAIGLFVAPSVASAQIPVRDRAVLEQISDRVNRYTQYTIFDSISAGVEDGRVTLSGWVTMPYKREDLERRVRSVDGVVSIENGIEVLPVSTFDDELRFRIARAIYGNSSFWQYASMVNPPIHVIVRRGRVTLEGVVKVTSSGCWRGRSPPASAPSRSPTPCARPTRSARGSPRIVRKSRQGRRTTSHSSLLTSHFGIAASAPDEPDEGHEGDATSTIIPANRTSVLRENRVAVHLHVDRQRRALLTIGQRLFPDDDVAALDGSRRRVVESDLARQVQPESDQLASRPSHISDVPASPAVDGLTVLAVSTETSNR